MKSIIPGGGNSACFQNERGCWKEHGEPVGWWVCETGEGSGGQVVLSLAGRERKGGGFKPKYPGAPPKVVCVAVT